MNERELAERLKNIEVLAQETHDAVVRLSAQMNGGPGQSFLCQQHRTMVADLDTRLRNMEQKTWYFLGIVAACVFAFGLFGPAIRHFLKLP
jgi:hypothetical protein